MEVTDQSWMDFIHLSDEEYHDWMKIAFALRERGWTPAKFSQWFELDEWTKLNTGNPNLLGH